MEKKHVIPMTYHRKPYCLLALLVYSCSEYSITRAGFEHVHSDNRTGSPNFQGPQDFIRQ